jgi:hypothetical protein
VSRFESLSHSEFVRQCILPAVAKSALIASFIFYLFGAYFFVKNGNSGFEVIIVIFAATVIPALLCAFVTVILLIILYFFKDLVNNLLLLAAICSILFMSMSFIFINQSIIVEIIFSILLGIICAVIIIDLVLRDTADI